MIINCIIILLASFLMVCFAIKKIIYIAHQKHLFDEPVENRKVHLTRTPNLGGVAIFCVFFLIGSIFITDKSISNINYLIAAAVILFALGLTDDLVGIAPLKKLIVQVLVALLVTTIAHIRFESLYGIFGIQQLPYWASIFVSTFFILFLVNAINLIDGINALAGSIGLLCCLIFSYFFWQLNAVGFLYLSIGMSGCLAGFLLFNITPAKIFMGDTGSLFLGFILAVFSIRFLELSAANHVLAKTASAISTPAIVLALLVIPIFDTVRVFTIRLVNKKSPFNADRNHIHHLLLDLKLSHLQATCILVAVNISAVLLVYLLGAIKAEFIFLIVTSYVLILFFFLWFAKHQLTVLGKKVTPSIYPDIKVSSVNYFITNGPTVMQQERPPLMEKV
jgi:UDP-GlcNAc:undecaprenyl-phosphate/decaprenyl-phosphate GlcNAc-1-phosphate transferase